MTLYYNTGFSSEHSSNTESKEEKVKLNFDDTHEDKYLNFIF